MNFEKYREEILKEFRFAHSLIPQNVYKVYAAACRYFGEERVQLDIGLESYNPRSYSNYITFPNLGSRITGDEIENPVIASVDLFWSCYGLLIYFPEVTVTNEMNESTVIRDFFARVPLTPHGKLATGFQFNKATYTEAEIRIGYMHSHCHSIDRLNPEYWQSPCLGSGPIRGTIAVLMQDFDEQRWGLFFWELDKVTQVESLSGVPYIKLQNIGISNNQEVSITTYNATVDILPENKETLIKFIKSYMSTGQMKFVALYQKITLGIPYIEWLVGISKYYMKWEQAALQEGEETLPLGWFKDYSVRDNLLYLNNPNQRYQSAIGRLIANFKGNDFRVNILNETDDVESVRLFDVSFANFILSQILTFINCYLDGNTRYSPEREGNHLKSRIIGITV